MKPADRAAVQELFRQHGKGVGGYVLARVGDAHRAEEITAQVFLQVVRKFHQLRGPAVGWLWAIVRNELAQHFRKRDRHVPLDAPLPARPDAADDEEARQRLHGRLQQALAQLPEEQRHFLYLKFFQHMRNADIAAATGRSPIHVGVIVHRAVKQLRRLMEDAHEPCTERDP